jgi:hypothetical protein
MKKYYRIIYGVSIALMLSILQDLNSGMFGQTQGSSELKVKKSTDFSVTGDGSSENWKKTDWTEIPNRTKSEEQLTTKVKVLYSGTGIYFLFNCQDKKLANTMDADFLDLWKEDVVEIFLWTDEKDPAYFEYEISPLNYELPILISNANGDLTRWMPFHYDPDRKTAHATAIQGGEKKSNAAVSGWSAEFFIPFKLLRPLKNFIPASGTKWRANMYRMDYDSKRTSWSWQLTTKSFHDYEKFGTFIFE